MNCTHWLGKLANLNVARTGPRGIAPHKPLMLLTLVDLIESGDIPDGWVKYDVRLVSRFRDYWELVQERQRNSPDIPMPFNALGGDKDQVWHCFTADGQPSKSKLTTRLCNLDPALYACLQDADFRREARRTLIGIYFTATEQVMLCARLGLPVPNTAEMDLFKQDREAFKKQQNEGRTSKFRSDIGAGYLYTCALTGYRLECTLGFMVQACHIHDHSKSSNNDPGNGLALTPDAHWMFDKGLWTAIPNGDDFIIHVAIGNYTESIAHGEFLARYNGRPLHFNPNAKLRPAVEHLEWHRQHHRI